MIFKIQLTWALQFNICRTENECQAFSAEPSNRQSQNNLNELESENITVILLLDVSPKV